MGSHRLPGKVLMDISGRSMLWHVVERLKTCKHLNGIVIATSTNILDDPIVSFGKQYNIPVLRGSEEDVLQRYIDVGEELQTDYIVRVTADSPLIEPAEIDRCIMAVKDCGAEYCDDLHDRENLLCGYETVALKTLKKINFVTTKYYREHVTTYIRDNLDDFKIPPYDCREEYCIQGMKLSVDTIEELQFMRKIYTDFWDGKNIVSLKRLCHENFFHH
jgi:spore coat polysaccharide biosynthesis protein SpsF